MPPTRDRSPTSRPLPWLAKCPLIVAISCAPLLLKTPRDSSLEEKYGGGKTSLRNYTEKLNLEREPKCQVLSLTRHSQLETWIYGHLCHHISRMTDLVEADSVALTSGMTKYLATFIGRIKTWPQLSAFQSEHIRVGQLSYPKSEQA